MVENHNILGYEKLIPCELIEVISNKLRRYNPRIKLTLYIHPVAKQKKQNFT